MAPPVATAPTNDQHLAAVALIALSEALEEIEFVDDLDEVAGNEVMRGCGNDNPY
ncbi:hypothetical protein [Streptomyces sp. LNU-CPARS28]|uniref:hypothetical protein n=1 Tax=Streptomyces sp. LNU-CPARS28 TaxID=3137371 RepID=UPI0031367370